MKSQNKNDQLVPPSDGNISSTITSRLKNSSSFNKVISVIDEDLSKIESSLLVIDDKLNSALMDIETKSGDRALVVEKMRNILELNDEMHISLNKIKKQLNKV